MWLQRWWPYGPKQHDTREQPLRVVIDVNALVSGTIVARGDSAFEYEA